jgi:hypothetical protein
MTVDRTGRNLEQQVAGYFGRNGYRTATNLKKPGRSGATHEIDVLATKADVAGTIQVVIECKAWRRRIEKDVVYKLHSIMQDLGLSKGIIVATGGLTSGARLAAQECHIEFWEADQIRHLLGEAALAGIPLGTPDQGLGWEPTITPEEASPRVDKARRSFGPGKEEIATIDLTWVPAIEFQLAINRTQPGLLRDKDVILRRWNIYEELTGRLLGEREEPRSFTPVEMTGAVLRRQRTPAQISGDMRRILAKHANARSDEATANRQRAYNDVGLPGSTTDFVIEAEPEVYLPFYVGSLRRKNSERLIAIHGQHGRRIESLERAFAGEVRRADLGASRTESPRFRTEIDRRNSVDCRRLAGAQGFGGRAAHVLVRKPHGGACPEVGFGAFLGLLDLPSLPADPPDVLTSLEALLRNRNHSGREPLECGPRYPPATGDPQQRQGQVPLSDRPVHRRSTQPQHPSRLLDTDERASGVLHGRLRGVRRPSGIDRASRRPGTVGLRADGT